MYHNPEFVKAVMEDREREIRHVRMVRSARRSQAVAPQRQERRRWPIRLRDALRV